MSVHCKHCPVRHNIGHPYINPVYSSPCPTVSETAVYMSCSLWPCFPSCVDSRNDPHVLLGFMSYFGPAFGSLQRDVEALIPASMVAVLSFVILTKQGPILYIVHVWKSLLLEVISSVFLNFSISSIKHINVFNITLYFTSSMILIYSSNLVKLSAQSSFVRGNHRTHGRWAARDHQRATPTVTRDIRLKAILKDTWHNTEGKFSSECPRALADWITLKSFSIIQ